ncbi:virulence RhuM family protein [Thiococcus pfennigii]|uniref:virulence RhuM family protein n=1 Tax=Thiococcus pfennigii TaxID=1057 RepID=UPI001902D4CA|nr:virulence RhuM family protein [Thiococcus pfennigii]MBK1731457.1 hydroxyacid dehydrogenase [Thiococcus pfennigii]
MSGGELILYTLDDGSAAIQLRAEGGTVWLTQLEMATLFDTSKQNISLHIKNILAEGELSLAVVKEYLTTASDGKKYKTKTYSLDMILAVGYRVRSPRGTQFRQWATTHLREYLVKGFVLDDARLKEPGGWDYFDELLARIRDIRASEKRFYQKIRDIYATAVDYDSRSEAAQLFFKKVQNKMLWAVTGHTAPELIAERANPRLPNMGVMTWKGDRVRKQDVTIAKNYLNQKEIEELDRIVVMYLDYAEDQARRRKTMTMRDWEDKLDAFLRFNEREVLTHAGRLRADVAEKLALERYESFDAARREAARLAADAEDMAALEKAERQLEGKGRGKKK